MHVLASISANAALIDARSLSAVGIVLCNKQKVNAYRKDLRLAQVSASCPSEQQYSPQGIVPSALRAILLCWTALRLRPKK